MRSKYTLIVLSVVAALAAVAVVVLAGDPDNPPGPPETTYSYTLEDIYNRLDTGAAGTPGAFTEPSSGPTMGTMHTLDEIYDLIGERAFVPKTGQVISHTTGDDGDLEMGVSRPNPSFITSTIGVVTDTLTGLVWLENANCTVFFSGDSTGRNHRIWSNAVTAANSLADGYCGLSDGSSAGDWRLPNVRELHSLIHYGVYDPAVPNTAGTGKWAEGDPFTGVQSVTYWASTSSAENTAYAWIVNLNYGYVFYETKTPWHYVWPVRGGQ